MKEFDEEKQRSVTSVDLGYSSCNIFFFQFTKKMIKVINVSSEKFYGEREFYFLIGQKLAYDFKKNGYNPMEVPKCKIILHYSITKVHRSLNVNKEITIFVDS